MFEVEDDPIETALINERQAGWNAGFTTASALWIVLFGLLVLAFILIGE